MRYAAFIRGINVGGKTLKMAELKKMFESLGFGNVTTYKAAGNVIFEGDGSAAAITKKIESGLHRLMGSETHAILRTMDGLKDLVASEPFKGVKDEPGTRLYVTFLPDGARPKAKERGDKTYSMRAVGSEIYTVLSPEAKTVDIMEMLDKEFGKVVTTRNWNTVVGIIDK